MGRYEKQDVSSENYQKEAAQKIVDGLYKVTEEAAQPITDFYYLLKTKLIGKSKAGLKTVEGDGAESDEEFEHVEGLTVIKEGPEVVNRRAGNAWSNMNSLETADCYENVNSVEVTTAPGEVIDLE